MKKVSTSMIRGIVSTVLGIAFMGLTASAIAQEKDTRDLIRPDAPDRHVVVRGDTLWGISGKFLKNAWRWPEVWRLNRDAIRNPHLIYPGQVVMLDRNTGRLMIGQQVSGGNARLEPQVRIEQLDKSPIPPIPASMIEPFLASPNVVDGPTLEGSLRVAATQEGRVFLGRGDTAYVRGNIDPNVKVYRVFRPTRPLIDPINRKTVLAYEAKDLGTAQLVKTGDPATFTITSSKEEIGAGDRLLPIEKATLTSYVPRAPEKEFNGRVVSVYDGVAQAGPGQIITLNLGKDTGLEEGHVLALNRLGETVADRSEEAQKKRWFGLGSKREMVKLPDERYGLVYVFRVYEKVSYALVMEATRPVQLADFAVQP